MRPIFGSCWYRGGRDLQTHALEDWMERGYAALRVMENHLKNHDYFAAGHLTVADIAMYGYTHVANQCDFDLSGYPSVRAWLKRVEAEPRFVSMDGNPRKFPRRVPCPERKPT